MNNTISSDDKEKHIESGQSDIIMFIFYGVLGSVIFVSCISIARKRQRRLLGRINPSLKYLDNSFSEKKGNEINLKTSEAEKLKSLSECVKINDEQKNNFTDLNYINSKIKNNLKKSYIISKRGPISGRNKLEKDIDKNSTDSHNSHKKNMDAIIILKKSPLFVKSIEKNVENYFENNKIKNNYDDIVYNCSNSFNKGFIECDPRYIATNSRENAILKITHKNKKSHSEDFNNLFLFNKQHAFYERKIIIDDLENKNNENKKLKYDFKIESTKSTEILNNKLENKNKTNNDQDKNSNYSKISEFEEKILVIDQECLTKNVYINLTNVNNKSFEINNVDNPTNHYISTNGDLNTEIIKNNFV